MKGFIVYQTYRIKGDYAYIFLYGRLENGQSFVTINKFEPYFYIKNSDLKKALKLEDFEYEETKLKTKEEEKATKIILTEPADVPKLRKILEDDNIQCYEADIRFTQRFLLDNGIQGSMDIEGEYESSKDVVDRIYHEPELKPVEWFPKLNVLSLDIETNYETDEILSIALNNGKEQAVLIQSKKKLKNAISCLSEEDLLEKFVDKFQEMDPDIIVGWNIINFDFKIIFEKLKKYKISAQLGRDNTNCKLRIEHDFFRESKADFPGRQVLDAMHILKSAFVKLKDYRLGTAAHTILGDKKLIGEDENKPKKIMEYFKEDPQKLVDYNLKDTELVLRILEKTDTLNLVIKKSLLTGMPLDRTSASIGSLDSLYLKEARKKGFVLPSSKFSERETPLKGGFVKESTPGIYDYIIVLDFKSLYPSIIKTFNIDPFTYSDKKIKNSIESPNGAYFRTDFEGILPSLFDRIWKERDEYKKKKDSIGIFALKILMNSFWGAVASPAYRMYNQNIGNAITGFARSIVQQTASEIEKLGYKVIYEDTDSNFVVSNAKSYEEAEKIGKKLEKHINEFYDNYIKINYKRDSNLNLQFEKVYIKFMMPKLRHGEKAAKKRYAGLMLVDGKEKIQTVGLETIRSDWTDVAKIYQKEILDRIFHNKDIIKYTKDFIKDIRAGKYDDKLVYIKSLRKDVENYAMEPPHLKAARKLDHIDSDKVEYVITTDGPEPIQKIKHKLNYDHYIDKQIKPLAESVLALIGETFEEVEKGHKQTSLAEF